MNTVLKHAIAYTTAITVLVGGVVGSVYALTPKYHPQKTDIHKVEEKPIAEASIPDMLKLVNKERIQAGARPLALDRRLNESAQFKADEMLDEQYLDHTNPKTGKDSGLDKALEIMQHECSYVSENIVHLSRGDGTKGFDTFSEIAVNWWVHSTSHYEAMVDSGNATTGFGIADNGYDVYLVEHFCKP